MKKLEFFDCEASFGICGYKRETTPITKEEMLSKFDRYGIERALVKSEYASVSVSHKGNFELLDEIKNDSRLYPLWVAIPHHTGEFPKPDELVELMKKNNVKVITLAPGNWVVGEHTCGELFTALEKYKIPLLLPISRVLNSFAGVYEILKEHRNLRIILTGIAYTCMRDVYPLLEMFDNLYICTSGYKAFEGIEDTVERFGAERLIFGSGMPALSGAASVALITYARISDNDKRMIASGNLERLMNEVTL